MPNSDSRSHSGCWTCRARRKKCDEEAMPCKTCAGLRLTCHGYGPRPAWMDGDVQEKTKVSEFKVAVRQNLRQRQKLRSLRRSETILDDAIVVQSACMTEGNQPLITPTSPDRDSPFDLPSPVLCFDQPLNIDDVFPSETSPHHCDIAHHVDLDPLDDFAWDTSLDEDNTTTVEPNSSTNSNFTPASSSLPLTLYTSSSDDDHAKSNAELGSLLVTNLSTVPQNCVTLTRLLILSPQDVNTVQTFVSRTCPVQFPFSDPASTSDVTQQLLTLAARSRSSLAAMKLFNLKRTSSALLRLGLAASEHLQSSHVDGEIRSCTTSGHDNANNDSDLSRIAAQLQTGQAIFSKIVCMDNSWPDDIDQMAKVTPLDYAKTSQGTLQQLGMIQGLLISMDILASTTTGKSPSFAMQSIKDLDDKQLDVEQVTGCSSAVMRIIMGVSNLQAWKLQQMQDSRLSMIELARRALKFEEELKIAQQETSSSNQTGESVDSLKDESLAITDIFARAAHIFLHTIVSGARPEIYEIKDGVVEVINALKRIPRADIIMSLSWPICIAACLADGEQRSFFESLERAIMDEFGQSQRVLRAFVIARECWRLRQMSGKDGKAYDWRDGMASLGQVVLLL